MEAPSYDSSKHLRHVELEHGFALRTWNTYRRDSYGKHVLGYQLSKVNVGVIFEGEDFACPPMHCIDSDDALRGILGFLTLRPGDTDADYFASYTSEQMAFALKYGEELSMHALDEDPLPWVRNLDGWEDGE